MLAATYTVSPSERRRFNLDCRPWLDSTESVVSATVEVLPGTDPPFFVPTLYVRKGERVVFLTSGGVDGNEYNATFNVVTSDGQSRSTCVRYIVREACATGQEAVV